MRRVEWVVYAKPPFGGPAQVLAYLGRYTHRVAITNSRLFDVTDRQVAFRWRDYRHHGKAKVMTLGADEFIRRFLLHTLPDGFHRIRHYGFLANGHRAENLALCRRLLAVPALEPDPSPTEDAATTDRTLCHGGRPSGTTRHDQPASPPLSTGCRTERPTRLPACCAQLQWRSSRANSSHQALDASVRP
jgi:hypothetical protein